MIDRMLRKIGLKRLKRKQNPLSHIGDMAGVDWGILEYSSGVATVIKIVQNIFSTVDLITRNQETLSRLFGKLTQAVETQISRIEKPFLASAAESRAREREIIQKLDQNTYETTRLKSACERILKSREDYEVRLSELAERRRSLYERAIDRLESNLKNQKLTGEDGPPAGGKCEIVRFGSGSVALRTGCAVILPVEPGESGACSGLDVIQKVSALREVIGSNLFIGVCCLAEVEDRQADSIAQAFSKQRTCLVEPGFIDSFARTMNLKFNA